MLILSRNTGQQIHIGDEVVVRVLEVNGQQVKIGIEAPKSISVDREEIYQRKKLTSGKTCANEPIQAVSTIQKSVLISYK